MKTICQGAVKLARLAREQFRQEDEMDWRGKIRGMIAAFTGIFLLAACTVVHSPPGTTTTVILLRHADRAPFQSDLNEKGVARAKALPAAVADLDINIIYSPDKKRNLDTVAPLIAERGIELRVIEVSDVAKRLVEENPGKTVIWVGNTDNLQTVYGLLGGRGHPPNNYGDLFVMQIGENGPPKIEMRHFGPE
tara:strand:+ start:2605 stop:3183 length:579 start_codon:yes stop_codon:yes gene_type:complete